MACSRLPWFAMVSHDFTVDVPHWRGFPECFSYSQGCESMTFSVAAIATYHAHRPASRYSRRLDGLDRRHPLDPLGTIISMGVQLENSPDDCYPYATMQPSVCSLARLAGSRVVGPCATGDIGYRATTTTCR